MSVSYTREYKRRTVQKSRDGRRKRGLCPTCGQSPLSPCGDGACEPCRGKRNAAKKAKRDALAERGICIRCGAAEAEGGKMCAPCRAEWNAYYALWSAKNRRKK